MFSFFLTAESSEAKSSGILEAKQRRQCLHEPGTVSPQSDQRRHLENASECF